MLCLIVKLVIEDLLHCCMSDQYHPQNADMLLFALLVFIPPLNESKKSITICSRKILKSVCDSTQPCLTAPVALNH